jgi:hypothetical protein
MCCSVSPGVPVHFSNTVLYAAEMLQENGDFVHVLGYQNKAQNHVGKAKRIGGLLQKFFNTPTGNAMILPFPAVPQSMSKANVLNTKNCPDILQSMAKALTPPEHLRSPSVTFAAAAAPQPRVQVFEAAGIYTVVLAQDALDIPAALKQVPKEKRPSLNAELFAAYAEWYPNWTFALCCFNNQNAALAHPMLWWYKPMFADRLFLPTLDGHTGEVPNLKAQVDVDHTLVVSSYQMQNGNPVFYTDNILALDSYLARKVIGQKYQSRLMNGDFICDIKDVRKAQFNPLRIPPTQIQKVSFQA